MLFVECMVFYDVFVVSIVFINNGCVEWICVYGVFDVVSWWFVMIVSLF